MISGKNQIKHYFQMVGYPYFKVYKRGQINSGNAVFESGEEENLSTEQSFERFERWLSLQMAGQFTLVLKEEPKKQKGNQVQDFEISFAEGAIPPAPAVLSGFTQPDPAEFERKVESRSAELLNNFKKEWELEQANKRIAELEKALKEGGGKETGMDKFLKVAGPHLGSVFPEIVKAFSPAAKAPIVGKVENMNMPMQGVAGTGDVAEMEPAVIVVDNGDDSPETQAVARFLATLQKLDPADWLTIIKRMTAKMEAEPGILSTLKMFI